MCGSDFCMHNSHTRLGTGIVSPRLRVAWLWKINKIFVQVLTKKNYYQLMSNYKSVLRIMSTKINCCTFAQFMTGSEKKALMEQFHDY